MKHTFKTTALVIGLSLCSSFSANASLAPMCSPIPSECVPNATATLKAALVECDSRMKHGPREIIKVKLCKKRAEIVYRRTMAVCMAEEKAQAEACSKFDDKNPPPPSADF